jgi:GAF domain-containing protein
MAASSARRKGYDLYDLGLLDGPREARFDRLVRLARTILDSDRAAFVVLDDRAERQFVKAHVGFGPPWTEIGEVPLSHSISRHVRDTGAALAIEDARADPRFAGNPSISDLGTVAYLGAPVADPHGIPIGALNVTCSAPRAWLREEVRVMSELAAVATDGVLLRAALQTLNLIRSGR